MFENFFDPNHGYYEPHTKPFLTSSLNVLYPEEAGPMEMEGDWSGPAVGSTAATKQLIFKTEMDEDSGAEWRHKEHRDWTTSDVMHWIASVAEAEGFLCECVNANAFNMDGKTLLTLSLKDFVARDDKYGHILYSALYMSSQHPESLAAFHPQPAKKDMKLETLTAPSMLSTPYSLVSLHHPAKAFHPELDLGGSSEPYLFDQGHGAKDEDRDTSADTGYSSARKNSLDSASSTTTDSECSDTEVKKVKKKTSAPGKRPPGRPPGVKTKKDKPEKKTGRLWEFIRDLLLDPQYCPSVICWENHDDGVFRFVKSEKVAKIWGTRKGNDKMNYEKLSRAMRYYYRSKVLQPVIGRRLVYKFGPTAKGWQTENPNFRH